MALLVNGDGRNLALAGLGNRHFHGARGDHVTESPITVDAGAVGRFALHLHGRAGHDVGALDARNVRGQQNDAVRVVPGEVGPHQVLHDDLGFLAGCTGGLQDILANPMKFLGCKSRHRVVSRLIRYL